MADNVLHHDHRTVHYHAEVERAQRQQVGGNVPQIKTDGGKEQRERNGERNDESAANIPQEKKENDHHEDDALGQIVQNRVGGVVQQVAAIQERNDLDSLWARIWSLSSSTLAWMPARVESESSPFCSSTIPSTTSPSSITLPSTR